MDAQTPRVLVAGATGYVGGRLVPELLAHGYRVRALARTPAKLRGRSFANDPGLEVAQGDVLDPASLTRAMEDVDTAYYLVHSMGAGSDFAGLDQQAAHNFATACRNAGVRRIVYLSALGHRGDPGLSPHLASRHHTADALRSAGVPVTELRAAIVVGSGSASYEIIHDLVRHLPVMVAPRWLRSRCEPIAIRDVVRYLVAVLDEPRTVGQTLDIGSGEVLTYQQMLELFARELGKKPRIIPLPILTPRLSSWWLHLVTSVDFSIAQPLVEGLRSDAVCEEHRIREWIPFPPTGYREAVRLALVRDQEPSRWSRWSDAMGRPRTHRAPGPVKHSFRDYRVLDVAASPSAVFDALTQLGGDDGYGGGVDALWRLRGALDRLAGGPGLRRGRPRGGLHEGDPLDFWRVARLRRPEILTLEAEMLTPGNARLDFRVEALSDGASRLHQLATLTGDSNWSRAYWAALWPLHSLVFPRLVQHVGELAEAATEPVASEPQPDAVADPARARTTAR